MSEPKKLIGHVVKENGKISYKKIVSVDTHLVNAIKKSRFSNDTIPKESMLFSVICNAMQSYADQETKKYKLLLANANKKIAETALASNQEKKSYLKGVLESVTEEDLSKIINDCTVQ